MKYISLKEASQISGYAPDYIGQLIRSGKLSGKQVYSNVAWVTTETALQDYLANSNKTKASGSVNTGNLEKIFPKVLKVLLYALVGISICFAIFLFYMISVQIDSKLKEKAVQKSEVSSL